MNIIHDVWKEMEVSTVARCWTKSEILTATADILAEHEPNAQPHKKQMI